MLVEETGCSKEEAKRYLEESSGNIALAVRNISRDIKPIGVLKCKFSVEGVSIYGLLLFIFNSRSRRMLRYAAVAGCNPEIYEPDIGKQWFSFEKELYSGRLKDGSLREITQKIEQSLIIRIQEEEVDNFYNLWESLDMDGIGEIVKGRIKDVIKYDRGGEYNIYMDINWQKLNLRQFKYLTDTEKINDEFKFYLAEEETYSTLIVLDTELVKNKDSSPAVKVEKIEAGDMVLTEIVDDRDIGIYLTHLLGARKENNLIPLSAPVEDVKDTKDGVEVIVRYGPGIIGRCIESPKKKVGIIRNPITHSYWWRYLLIMFGAAIGYYLIFAK